MVASNIAQPHDGKNGTNGTNGTDGRGYPAGGVTGQVLAKIDGADYNTHWIDPPAAGGSVVQQAIATTANLSTGVAFVTAPTDGNLLIAIVVGGGLFSDLADGAGWTRVGRCNASAVYGTCLYANNNNTQSYMYTYVYAKVASGESTTQSPSSSAASGIVAMWELSGCFIGAGVVSVGASSGSQAAGVEQDNTYLNYKIGQLTIGAFLTNDATLPASTTNMGHAQSAIGNGYGGTAFYNLATAPGSVTAAYTHTAGCYMSGWTIPVG